jgi:Leucine-rich repeat (LRR) protein
MERRITNYLKLSIFALTLAAFTALEAQSVSEKRVEDTAMSFLNMMNRKQVKQTKSFQPKHATLKKRYQSSGKVNSPLYVYQQNSSFVMVADVAGTPIVLGYCDNGDFDASTVPVQLKALMRLYEESQPYTISSTSMHTPVVSPLLDEAGIKLNQFTHPEANGCPTGCVATAITQIMLYQSLKTGKPIKGNGSHCYTSITSYGMPQSICADFQGVNYDINTAELLSFHVGVAMEMQYCFDAYGSSPDLRHEEPLKNHFNHTTVDLTKFSIPSRRTREVMHALDGGNPVYVTISGEPVGHAFVADGYDSEGYIHLNFGWGGSHNGYYLLNTGKRFSDGNNLIFSSYMRDVSLIFNGEIPLNQDDDSALRQINASLGGSTVTNWDESKPVTEWNGVSVLNGRVIGLDINIEPKNETTLSPAISNLTALRYLNIVAADGQNANLKVNTADIIGSLSQLEWLVTGNVMLQGSLPASIGNLTNLELLSISNNASSPGNLSGSIPAEIGSLQKLNSISIRNQKLTGNIPHQIANLSNINSIDLANNSLEGEIPALNMPNLQFLNLSDNKLNGIADGEWKLDKLSDLNLANNRLSGPTPQGFGSFLQLEYINLSNNQISALSEGFGDMPMVKKLDLTDNSLESIPNSIGKMTSLETLLLDRNRLTSIPETIANCCFLKHISATKNKLATLPESMADLRNLVTIDFSDNELTSLPKYLGQDLTHVNYDFHNNRIEHIPDGFNSISNGRLHLYNNELRGDIPHSILLIPDGDCRLENNRFIFEDIPNNDDLKNRVGTQKTALLSKNSFQAVSGDTIKIDIREISNLSHPGNEYYWLCYPDYHPDNTTPNWQGSILPQLENNPVLTLPATVFNAGKQYYCKVINHDSPKYLYEYNNSLLPCLDEVNTDKISIQLVSNEKIEDDRLSELYPDSHILSANEIINGTVSNHTVRLTAPANHLRGSIIWQASADGKTWIEVNDNIVNASIRENIEYYDSKEIVIIPKTTAFYRCMRVETGCENTFSDPVKVEPQGNIIFDEVVTDVNKPFIAAADSIEVHLPAGLHNEPFRLTICKVTNPPAAPSKFIMGSVYDVRVSFGSLFDVPIIIKLKNYDRSKVSSDAINRYKAAYFDEANRQWITYNNSEISLIDSTLIFETYHLTRIGWLSDPEAKAWGYSHKYSADNITVYWDENRIDFINLYGINYKQTPNPLPSIPFMVQDVVKFLNESRSAYRNKFDLHTTQADNNFCVYIKEMNNEGDIGIGGQSRGYLNISDIIDKPGLLRTTIAHEFLHYLQGQYFKATAGNVFWAEANAVLADHMVWDSGIVPEAEPETIVKRGTERYKNTIYSSLANSWDYWDHYTAGMPFGNIDHCYMAGGFLHYLRSYRQGTKLNPGDVLKQFPDATFGFRWRHSLEQYIISKLNSDIGKEYEDYVKFLLTEGKSNFTIINPLAPTDPYRTAMFTDKNGDKTFADRYKYYFNENEIEQGLVKEENIQLSIPYLASKMIVLENNTPHEKVVVTYTPDHENKDYQKVYYGVFDMEKRAMNLTDITDSVSYSAVLTPFQSISNDKKSLANHSSFLLFINSQSPNSSSQPADFEPSFKLSATPVMNIHSVGMLNIYDGSDIHQHNFSNESSIINFGVMNTHNYPENYPAEVTDYSISQTCISPNVMRIITRYKYIHDQGQILGTTSVKDEILYTQTIDYDIINSNIKATEQKDAKRWIYPLYEFNEDLKDYELIEAGYIMSETTTTSTYRLKGLEYYVQPDNSTETEAFKKVYGDDIKLYLTSTTSETKSVVDSIESVVKTTNFNRNGSVSSTQENRYINTDWNKDGLILRIILRLKPLE